MTQTSAPATAATATQTPAATAQLTAQLGGQDDMGLLQAALDDMESAALEALIERAQNTLASKRAGGMTFSFDFEATNDPRKGVPYVARLHWQNGKIERAFFDLQRSYGKKLVTISGQYTAKAGDVIEKRVGGSWANDYRAAYLVLPDGTLHELGSMQSSTVVDRLKRYLSGKLDLDALVAG